MIDRLIVGYRFARYTVSLCCAPHKPRHHLSIQARLDEMQAQYDRLLTEVEGAKSAAREEAIRALDAGEPPKSPTPAAQE